MIYKYEYIIMIVGVRLYMDFVFEVFRNYFFKF